MSCIRRGSHTGLLFLYRELIPVHLHTVSQRHPEIGLLLWWHGLPSLLNVGQSRVGNSVRTSHLLEGVIARGGQTGQGLTEKRCCSEHCGGG